MSEIKNIKICIDQGHGGKDPGALGNGLRESDLNLSLGLKVGNYLERSGAEVIYTRTIDVFIDLNPRAVIANNAKADWFIAFHRNSGVKEASGIETYTYLNASEKTRSMAIALQNAQIKVYGGIDRGVKQANFAVLRETNMSAILLETGFISNTDDSNKMKNAALEESLAKEIAKAICFQVGLKFLSKEVKALNRDEALKLLVDNGVINSPDYWNKVADVVQHFEKFIINAATKIKGV